MCKMIGYGIMCAMKDNIHSIVPDNGRKITRRSFFTSAVAAGATARFAPLFASSTPLLVKPTPQQVVWSDQELGMFFHMDLPIFQRRGKNVNTEHCQDILDPRIYNPAKLDTDQWMEAAKAMGAKYVVFVAYHGSGFMQWQSDLFPYGLKQSPWRGGKGDVVRSFVESARKYGMKPGLYAYARGGKYLDSQFPVKRADGSVDMAMQKAKSKMIERYLEELWRDYGEFFELWYDGGVLPVSQGGPDVESLVAKYQPNAILFQGPGHMKNLVRWVGNERGVAPYPCWSTTEHVTQSHGDKEGRFAGHPDGAKWIPGECDLPLRFHRWFWTPENEPKRGWRYWTDDELVDKYYTSVGRNCNMLLNANINTDGLVPEEDFGYYVRLGKNIRARFANPLATASGEGDVLEMALPAPGPVNQIAISEDIREGQRIRAYKVEGLLPGGGWKTLCEGTSVGHKRIQMFAPEAVARLRFTATASAAKPILKSFVAWNVKGKLAGMGA